MAPVIALQFASSGELELFLSYIKSQEAQIYIIYEENEFIRRASIESKVKLKRSEDYYKLLEKKLFYRGFDFIRFDKSRFEEKGHISPADTTLYYPILKKSEVKKLDGFYFYLGVVINDTIVYLDAFNSGPDRKEAPRRLFDVKELDKNQPRFTFRLERDITYLRVVMSEFNQALKAAGKESSKLLTDVGKIKKDKKLLENKHNSGKDAFFKKGSESKGLAPLSANRYPHASAIENQVKLKR